MHFKDEKQASTAIAQIAKELLGRSPVQEDLEGLVRCYVITVPKIRQMMVDTLVGAKGRVRRPDAELLGEHLESLVATMVRPGDNRRCLYFAGPISTGTMEGVKHQLAMFVASPDIAGLSDETFLMEPLANMICSGLEIVEDDLAINLRDLFDPSIWDDVSYEFERDKMLSRVTLA